MNRKKTAANFIFSITLLTTPALFADEPAGMNNRPIQEVARDHADKVLWDLALNYNYHDNVLPDFTPIPAP